MEKQQKECWGIDVSKNWLDISIRNKVCRVEQTKTAVNAFIQRQKIQLEVLCVIESTGGYERLAVDCFDKSGLTVHVAHPNRVRDFAKAKGYAAKSDQLDARILENYGYFMDPAAIHPLPTQQEQKLTTLCSRLSQLKQMHHQEVCRLGMAEDKVLKQSHKRLMSVIDQQLKKVEQQLLSIIDADEQLATCFKRLQTMKGVGPVLAMTLIADLPELGKINKKSIAALVGVVPITKESGQMKGRARTQNGRNSVRRALYMGALSAVRYDKKMKAFYERLLAKGKPKKVGLVAVMRKMLVILNAMVGDNLDCQSCDDGETLRGLKMAKS